MITRVIAAAGAAFLCAAALAGCTPNTLVADPLPVSDTAHFPADTQGQLEDAVAAAMTATGSSGAIVGVWAPWSGAWVGGVGTTAPGGSTKTSPGMTFRAGEVTRAMTCDALYRVAAAGTVHLDDSITDYVGGMPKFTDVTLQSLCDGTSGIGSYGKMLDSAMADNPGRQWNPRELVGYGVGQVRGDVRPGEAYRDSDAGYVLLGLALEAATGKTAQELLKKQVFAPLGLRETELPAAEPDMPTVGSSQPLGGFLLTTRDKSGAYECDKQVDVTEQSASYGFTDSGVVTDIQDLGTYVRALAAGTLVHDNTRFKNGRPVSRTAPTWFTAAGGAIEAGPLIGQYGAAPGYLTAAFSEPHSGLTVAVVLNNSTAGKDVVLDLSRELAAIASKAHATGEKAAPALGLPWTAEQYHDAIAESAVCSAPGS